MTNKEIFEKVIEKAEKNGYVLRKEISLKDYDKTYTYQGVHWTNKRTGFLKASETIFDIIFSHDFAKAFWGEEINEFQFNDLWDKEILAYEHNILKNCEYHLQQMVILPDNERIKYLGKFL